MPAASLSFHLPMPMRLNTQLALRGAALFAAAAATLLLFLHVSMKNHALAMAREKADILLANHQATLRYFSEELRPRVFALMGQAGLDEDYFDPVWMSATYANRIIAKYFGAGDLRDYYYKNAAIDARSPENEADEMEREFLERAKAGSGPDSWSGVREFDHRPFFVFMKTNALRYNEFCLRCHSVPENAPAGMIRLYGGELSFHREAGKIASVLSVRIPMETAFTKINALTTRLAAAVLGIVAIFFLLFFLLIRRTVLLPLNQFVAWARGVERDETLLGETMSLSGAKEFEELSQAFNAMSTRLAASRARLEHEVEARTMELRRANLDLEHERALLGGIMDSSPDAIFQVSRDGAIHHANEKTLELADRAKVISTRTEMLRGLVCGEVFGGETLRCLEKGLAAARETGLTWEGRFKRGTNGKEKTCNLRVTPKRSDEKGAIDDLLCIVRDVTAEVAVAAQAREEAKQESLATMAGGVAHDVNNLLATLMGNAELLAEEPEMPPQVRQISEDFLRAGRRLSDIVRELLRFSRHRDTPLRETDVPRLVKERMEQLRPTLPGKVRLRVESEGSAMVRADAGQLEHLLSVLLDNAVEAMEGREGEISVTVDQYAPTAELPLPPAGLAKGDYLRIAVRDEGRGMSADLIEQIFDPYFSTKGIGNGLGLAAARGIAGKHGGAITVRSTEGKGSTFEVLLPLAGPVEREAASGA